MVSLIINIAIPLAIGGLSGLFISGSTDVYNSLILPPLAPPSILFPIVWTIMYVLMGIASYLVVSSSGTDKKLALILYGSQLIVNFFWSIIFFNAQNYLFAFLWLILLAGLIIFTIVSFYKINKKTIWFLLPYLIWVIFAGYLNYAIYVLN